MTVFGPPTGEPAPATVANVRRRADARLIAAAPSLRLWLINVATDAQLDARVPALDGMTGRELLAQIDRGTR